MSIIHNPALSRFEVSVEGEIAHIDYVMRDNAIAITSTRVPDKISGRGIGTALVKQVFAYAREKDLVVKPYCSFVVDFLNKNKSFREQLKLHE